MLKRIIICFVLLFVFPSAVLAVENTNNSVYLQYSYTDYDLPIEHSAIVDNLFLQSVSPIQSLPKQISVSKVGVGDGYCVSFVKSVVNTSLAGNAYEWRKYINSNIPEIGSIVVLTGNSSLGHLAVVTSISPDNISVYEQNYKGRYIVSSRSILLSSSEIIGYINL